MSVAEPGLTGTTKAVTDKLFYTESDTVSWRMPRVPQLKFDWTEAAFELSFKLTVAMVLYVGVPTMGGIVGNGKPSTILPMAVGMVVGAVVLVEECGRGVESIAKFGDLGGSGVDWDVG